uniref:Uncharacterized protein n=1 Tax=Alexandrium monilatum TaxID=311494 RepID=A0A7S4W0W3_9DINO
MWSTLRGLPRAPWRWLTQAPGGPTAAGAVAAAALLACNPVQIPDTRQSRQGRRQRDSLRRAHPHLARCEGLQVEGGPRFSFCERTDSYTPVFVATATANTASVNVNGALLRGYARSMGNVGMKEDVYDRLYSAMLREAQAAPGRLRAAVNAPQGAVGAMHDLGFAGSFSRVPGHCSPSQHGAVGAVFIDVYAPAHRPLCERNVALIYVEGPNGNVGAGGTGLFGVARPAIGDSDDFLKAVEDTASNTMLAVREYNGLAEVGRAGPEALPRIEVLQFCLVSGGPYRHPEVSKLDVAKAIVRGLIAGCSGGSPGTVGAPPAVRLAYDEDVFRTAVKAVAG